MGNSVLYLVIYYHFLVLFISSQTSDFLPDDISLQLEELPFSENLLR